MMSNWVGFACGYAPYGPTQWRLPLGLQIPFGIILFIGLLTFMPDSPRQLVRNGQIEKARLEFIKIRRDLGLEEVHQEFAFMQTQIEYEMQREIKSYREIWRLFKHRVLVAVGVQTMTSLTGTNVISYYQSKNASPSWMQHQADSLRSDLVQVSGYKLENNSLPSRCIRNRWLHLQLLDISISRRPMGTSQVCHPQHFAPLNPISLRAQADKNVECSFPAWLESSSSRSMLRSCKKNSKTQTTLSEKLLPF